ncbi:MAG: TIGR04283 family arsenosugar biosynthesis glycosyltransferase [candidate division Zixibacteria bacterium]|nr:TIGR04283 family arsenosugar biosynthesis glycosyltransferase [candidate division Zixibacteria bacterium]
MSDALPSISVVIPALNEETVIGACLEQFRDIPDPLEILVVDGGSIDRTRDIAATFPRTTVLNGPRGRAVQMNAGAAAACGDILVFLHADTFLPEAWHHKIAGSFLLPGVSGGRFRFDIAHPATVYRWIAFGTNFRSRVLGITYGDQVIYTRSNIFRDTGGYPVVPIFEDSEFATRLKRHGLFDWIDAPVMTSARRWQRRGALRTLLLTWALRTFYTVGVSPETLHRFYTHVR